MANIYLPEPRGPERYIDAHGKRYEPPDRLGFNSVGVLPELTGCPWNEIALAFVHSVEPSLIRVRPHNDREETTDTWGRRVTIYLDEEGRIEYITQELRVGLPSGIDSVYKLRTALERAKEESK